MNLFSKCRSLLVILVLLATTVLSTALRPAQSALAQSGPPTYDTNLTLKPNSNDTRACFDSLNPYTLLVDEPVTGTSTLNWRTGERTRLNSANNITCGPNGWIYGQIPGYTGVRFTVLDPTPQQIEHIPQYMAEDGSRQVYATDPFFGQSSTTRMWASPDAGETWQERTLPGPGQLTSLSVSETDARAIYALTLDRTVAPPQPSWIYFSSDAGATWTLHNTSQVPNVKAVPFGLIQPIPGHAAPIDTVYMRQGNGLNGSGGASSYLISTDGARTFTSVDNISNMGYHSLELVHTQEGIVRSRHGRFFGPQELTLTTDSGKTWAPLPMPPLAPLPPPAPGVPPLPAEATLTVAGVAPANLFLSDLNQGLWHSPDNGHTWTQLTTTGAQVVATSPYLPLAVLYTDANNLLHVMEIPNADRYQTAAVPPNQALGSAYYPVPGINHNVPEVFARYWATHGGLAQFGYPRTEAFPEVSATDGKIYLTQYFERNRFEYHPEYAGTAAEILLGLLGNEQTAARRAAGEAPFARVPNPQQPINDVLYFPQTGHTLRDPLMRYWQAHGGLDAYGYPISEPFKEVNPTDGKPYLVQYFERNRLEFHPENVGTPYEILLGLLGNDLLKQKGWQ